MNEAIQGMTIGYLGPQETFSEVAMESYFKGRPYQAFPFSTIPDVLRALHREEVHWGVVPIENSIEGTVNVTLDMLVHEVELQLSGEVVIPVSHCLMSKAADFTQIKKVLSHPQGLAQCRKFIEKNLPWTVGETSVSTAEGARLASLGGPETAAIGTCLAAQRYGLNVLAQDIQDYAGNFTRFVILSKEKMVPTGNDKTSMAFALDKDRPGGLYEILGEFATRSINLTKIESRPTKNYFGEYLFFIDCIGHQEADGVREAISALRQRASFIKILGSYPRGEEVIHSDKTRPSV